MKLTKESCKGIMDQTEEYLQNTLKGIKVTRLRGKYTESTLKLTIELQTEGGASKEALAWKKHCFKFLFAPTDLHKEFHYNGTRYRIIGLRPRANKRPILCCKLSDPEKRVVFPASIVHTRLAEQHDG